MEDLKPLMGARHVRMSEPGPDEALMKVPSLDSLTYPRTRGSAGRLPQDIQAHPISREDADALCYWLILRESPRSMRVLLDVWWDYLRRAPEPQQKLTAQRMIEAITMAWGMSRVEEVIRIHAEDEERERAAEQAERDRAEADAVDRWKTVRVCS